MAVGSPLLGCPSPGPFWSEQGFYEFILVCTCWCLQAAELLEQLGSRDDTRKSGGTRAVGHGFFTRFGDLGDLMAHWVTSWALSCVWREEPGA